MYWLKSEETGEDLTISNFHKYHLTVVSVWVVQTFFIFVLFNIYCNCFEPPLGKSKISFLIFSLIYAPRDDINFELFFFCSYLMCFSENR